MLMGVVDTIVVGHVSATERRKQSQARKGARLVSSDSLLKVIAELQAHPDTVHVAVHDTVVRVANASRGWWAEFWSEVARFVAQLIAAGIALAGAWYFEKTREKRQDRLVADAVAREDRLRIEKSALGYLWPIRRVLDSLHTVTAQIGNKEGFSLFGPRTLHPYLEPLGDALADLFEAQKANQADLKQPDLEKRTNKWRVGAERSHGTLVEAVTPWLDVWPGQPPTPLSPSLGQFQPEFDRYASEATTHHHRFQAIAKELEALAGLTP